MHDLKDPAAAPIRSLADCAAACCHQTLSV